LPDFADAFGFTADMRVAVLLPAPVVADFAPMTIS
jgi:hypothetical protein